MWVTLYGLVCINVLNSKRHKTSRPALWTQGWNSTADSVDQDDRLQYINSATYIATADPALSM